MIKGKGISVNYSIMQKSIGHGFDFEVNSDAFLIGHGY